MKLSKSDLVQLIREEQAALIEDQLADTRWTGTMTFRDGKREYGKHNFDVEAENIGEFLSFLCRLVVILTADWQRGLPLGPGKAPPRGPLKLSVVDVTCPNGGKFRLYPEHLKNCKKDAENDFGWKYDGALPQEYYENCAPAIAESKGYKRLAKKWLSEKRKISARKISRVLLQEMMGGRVWIEELKSWAKVVSGATNWWPGDLPRATVIIELTAPSTGRTTHIAMYRSTGTGVGRGHSMWTPYGGIGDRGAVHVQHGGGRYEWYIKAPGGDKWKNLYRPLGAQLEMLEKKGQIKIQQHGRGSILQGAPKWTSGAQINKWLQRHRGAIRYNWRRIYADKFSVARITRRPMGVQRGVKVHHRFQNFPEPRLTFPGVEPPSPGVYQQPKDLGRVKNLGGRRGFLLIPAWVAGGDPKTKKKIALKPDRKAEKILKSIPNTKENRAIVAQVQKKTAEAILRASAEQRGTGAAEAARKVSASQVSAQERKAMAGMAKRAGKSLGRRAPGVVMWSFVAWQVKSVLESDKDDKTKVLELSALAAELAICSAHPVTALACTGAALGLIGAYLFDAILSALLSLFEFPKDIRYDISDYPMEYPKVVQDPYPDCHPYKTYVGDQNTRIISGRSDSIECLRKKHGEIDYKKLVDLWRQKKYGKQQIKDVILQAPPNSRQHAGQAKKFVDSSGVKQLKGWDHIPAWVWSGGYGGSGKWVWASYKDVDSSGLLKPKAKSYPIGRIKSKRKSSLSSELERYFLKTLKTDAGPEDAG